MTTAPSDNAAADDAIDGSAVHPMVPVPDALLTVLRETARSILLANTSHSLDTSSSSQNEEPGTTTLRLHDDEGTPHYQAAIGRILAHDVIVKDPYPPFDASIMDGYAVNSADLETIQSNRGKEGEAEWTHAIVGQIFAGDEVDGSAPSHSGGDLPHAAYVTTGAVVPAPYDAVVPIEDIVVSADGAHLRITSSDPSKIKPGTWIRKVGCDMAAASVALSAGTVLQPPHIGILIQVGINELLVRELPKVGVLSTGNEILPSHHHPSASGKIPDVNRPVLLSTMTSWGNCIPIDLGIETDDNIDQLVATLKSAMDRCDVIVTTGGISMGDKDVMEDVLVRQFGAQVHFGRIHMKPGKPTTFMTINVPEKQRKCLVFCLPGNPVSGIVCSHLFVRPCLDMLVKGVDSSSSLEENVENATVQEEIVATLTKAVKLDVERPEYRRVSLSYEVGSEGGRYMASSTGVQRSSRLMSMNGADGLMLLPKGEPGEKMMAKEGETYPVMLLAGGVGTTGVKVRDSVHISGLTSDKISVAIIHIAGANALAKTSELKKRTSAALGIDTFRITMTTEIDAKVGTNAIADALRSSLTTKCSILLAICSDTLFEQNLDISSALRKQIDKEADAMAMQARKGAAEQDATAALFEYTAGLIRTNDGHRMMLLLSEKGLEGALGKVAVLLPHGLKVANQAHDHQQQHKRHKH